MNARTSFIYMTSKFLCSFRVGTYIYRVYPSSAPAMKQFNDKPLFFSSNYSVSKEESLRQAKFLPVCTGNVMRARYAGVSV